MAKLKVYRTAIGFHDAYVAAPSQAAALQAWGTDKNLFAHSAAEVVTDDKLTAEPLSTPGKVIKRLRGTADEQMAALPPDGPKRRHEKKEAGERPAKAAPRKAVKRPPPPSRAKLEAADATLGEFEHRAAEQLADLAHREAALARERKDSTAAISREKAKLTEERDEEAATYDRALKRWRAADLSDAAKADEPR